MVEGGRVQTQDRGFSERRIWQDSGMDEKLHVAPVQQK